VQRFSRHKILQTVLRYDDNRLDLAGDIARRVAEASQGEVEVPLARTTPRW
jgi:hypothetical protein